jgi:hypothetical protein
MKLALDLPLLAIKGLSDVFVLFPSAVRSRVEKNRLNRNIERIFKML